MDVRFLLEEADPELEFILETPEELTNYIKQYEEDKNPKMKVYSMILEQSILNLLKKIYRVI